jgi:hypothetical protein
MAGLRDVMTNAVVARKQGDGFGPQNEQWASSNLPLNTRPRAKRGGGM